jgi:deoxyribodipyrimidine photo-lyase
VEFEPHFASRKTALERLRSFLPRAGETYARTRNYDYGPLDRANVSCLSPFLSRRLIAEWEVLRSVVAVHTPTQAEKFNQEVLWRSYWKAWLEMRPWVWQEYCAWLEGAESVLVQSESSSFKSALQGSTGIPAFDFWRKELRETGYLHNHSRMWFASIWIFTLGLPWQLGAKLFLSELVDGDSASNTLSWRWVAGLHTPGKLYVAKKENIEKYTQGRFPASAPYRLREEVTPLAELKRPLEPKAPLKPAPAPRGRLGLVLHAEDLCPETTELALLPFVDTAVWSPALAWEKREAAGHVREWDRLALEDAGTRWQRKQHEKPSLIALGSAEELTAWAKERGIDAIVSPKAFTGFTLDTLLSSAHRLPIPLYWAMRSYDWTLQPFAEGGFFSFKKAMPKLLKKNGSQGGALEAVEYFKHLPDKEHKEK